MLKADFREISATLGNGIFAAYLLALAMAREETAAAKSADFAEKQTKLAAKAGVMELRFDVAPKEAIDYFSRKKIVPKREFKQLEDDAKSAAFTVGGVYEQRVLDSFHSEILDALKNGRSHKDVATNFQKILDGAGHDALGDSRLELIARTNLQTAYGVGRRRALEESADLLPFWEYSAVGDDRTRPSHRALDGVILPANHEFWDAHYPPWGFNCRCTVVAVGEMPDGYDPAKPNGESTIAYDENGNPTKAEIDTQVVDLSAGKFRGVPRQNVGLKQTIIEAATESATKELASIYKREKLIDPDNTDVPETLRDLIGADAKTKIRSMAQQMKAANFKYEHAVIVDTDGAVKYYKIGTFDSVDIVESAEDEFKGMTLLHRHPNRQITDIGGYANDGGPLSAEDIVAAAHLKLGEIVAAADSAIYRATSGRADGWHPDITATGSDADGNGIQLFVEEFTALRDGFYAESAKRIKHQAHKEGWSSARLLNALYVATQRAHQATIREIQNKYEIVYVREKY